MFLAMLILTMMTMRKPKDIPDIPDMNLYDLPEFHRRTLIATVFITSMMVTLIDHYIWSMLLKPFLID